MITNQTKPNQIPSKNENVQTVDSSWWFQPTWNILVNLDNFPR